MSLAVLMGSLFEPLQTNELSNSEMQFLARMQKMRKHFHAFERDNRELLETVKRSGKLYRCIFAERVGQSHWWRQSAGSKDYLKSLFQLFCLPQPSVDLKHSPGITGGLLEEVLAFRSVHNFDVVEPEAQLLCMNERERQLCAEVEECLSRTPAGAIYMFDGQQSGRRAQVDALLEQLAMLRSRLRYAQARQDDSAQDNTPMVSHGYTTLFAP